MTTKICGKVTQKLHNYGHRLNRSKTSENCTTNMIAKFCRKVNQKQQYTVSAKSAEKLIKNYTLSTWSEVRRKHSETAENIEPRFRSKTAQKQKKLTPTPEQLTFDEQTAQCADCAEKLRETVRKTDVQQNQP